MLKDMIKKVADRQNLTAKEAKDAMKIIMSGNATDAQIAAFLTALRMKGETVEEIASFAQVMREFAESIHPDVSEVLVDTCGTGGDRLDSFNISTATAFVVAGAGVPVAKHGGRSVSSKCGSADVLEALGVNIELQPEKVKRSIEEIGIGFMFAPIFHKAMMHVATVRREIGIRTVFNILGPLTNPANAKAQLLGVYDKSLTLKIAEVLKNLGTERAMVVYGVGGLDEISNIGETIITELKYGKIKTYAITPEEYGFKRVSIENIVGKTAKENANIIRDILAGKKDPKRDIVIMNSAAAIMLGGKAKDFKEGIAKAQKSIDNGLAHDVLERLIEVSNRN